LSVKNRVIVLVVAVVTCSCDEATTQNLFDSAFGDETRWAHSSHAIDVGVRCQPFNDPSWAGHATGDSSTARDLHLFRASDADQKSLNFAAVWLMCGVVAGESS
jgi:hypothetical protein